MSDLSPKQIVDWFRQQAIMFNEMANNVEQTFTLKPTAPLLQSRPIPMSGTVTAEQLESRVREKSGRISNLANHFNVREESIISLLHPASRVYVAERGWLKLRE
jgi:hypothetical protein